MKEYKSPWGALLWSLALPGFGQLYNRDYFMAVILIILELSINHLSNLNLSILHTFHGQFHNAHDVVNFEHGLFYPSIWGFSMWQAYNNAKKSNGDPNKRAYLTGTIFGLVAGMNMGLVTHGLFHSPIFGGLATGVAGAIIGCTVELLIRKVRNNRYSG